MYSNSKLSIILFVVLLLPSHLGAWGLHSLARLMSKSVQSQPNFGSGPSVNVSFEDAEVVEAKRLRPGLPPSNPKSEYEECPVGKFFAIMKFRRLVFDDDDCKIVKEAWAVPQASYKGVCGGTGYGTVAGFSQLTQPYIKIKKPTRSRALSFCFVSTCIMASSDL